MKSSVIPNSIFQAELTPLFWGTSNQSQHMKAIVTIMLISKAPVITLAITLSQLSSGASGCRKPDPMPASEFVHAALDGGRGAVPQGLQDLARHEGCELGRVGKPAVEVALVGLDVNRAIYVGRSLARDLGGGSLMEEDVEGPVDEAL